jgi:diguanylate cyclase (GGDEF)-like protein
MDAVTDDFQVHVLLVEDNPVDASLVRHVLDEHQPERYIFTHVACLSDAEDLAESYHFGVVLLDLNLPDMQGPETFVRLSAIAPQLPIIILTDAVDQILALQLVQMGAQDFLLKEEIEGRLIGRAIRYAIARKDIEKKLEDAAHYDSLTGLPNRALFNDRLEQAAARIRRKGGALSLLFLDLDRFKEVNDTLGHAAGDELLAQLGRRLDTVLRKSDTVARMGGDEFTVIIEAPLGDDAVFLIADKLLVLFDRPFCVAGQDVFVGASIGIAIAIAPKDDIDPDALLSRADTAMYRAKACGGNRYWVYQQDDDAKMADEPDQVDEPASDAEEHSAKDIVAARYDIADVLLVDDNPGDRRLITEALREASVRHRLHTSTSGEKAIACLQKIESYPDMQAPRLILLDIHKNGLHVLRRIRATPHLNSVPVVVLSSSRDQLDIANAYREGANAYVVKPIGLERFVKSINTLIDYWLEVVLVRPLGK